MLFKQLKNNETLNIDDIFEILTKFDPSKDEFCENIEYPKNNQVYLHYSTDDKKVDDWKADGMLWENNEEKVRGSKKILYKGYYII